MRKRILYEIQGLYREDFRVTGYEFGEGKEAVCIVGSMRGNEVQQLYCCSRLVKKLKSMEEERKLVPGHKILVIPCVNPYSMNIQKRFWTVDNTDINRMFPGYDLGETTQRIADGVFRVISAYEIGIQFTSFYMPGEFMPHVRMMDTGFEDIALAKQFGMPYVVLRKVRPYDTTTLNYNWQIWEKQAFSLYTATTSRIDKKSAKEAIRGILTFLQKQGIAEYRGHDGYQSQIVWDVDMVSVRATKAGLFDPAVSVGEEVERGQLIACLLDACEGEVIEELRAPVDGIVFFMHGDALTYANTAVCKLVVQSYGMKL
ncbi:MAG: M14 family metallopeptidase [bacterium]|nr:M14 family metallopeptidase [bacterium]MCM1423628.1 M14 family metallopeptidase [bacterium]